MDATLFVNVLRDLHWDPKSTHRGLKLDGAIGQGETYNSLKSEKFSLLRELQISP